MYTPHSYPVALLMACALLFGLTLGRTNPAAAASFFHNLDSASTRALAEASAGGMLLLVNGAFGHYSEARENA